MRKLHHVTRKVDFYVMAEGEAEAEQIAKNACPFDVIPALATEDTRVYCTPNQTPDLQRMAINFGD